MKVLYIITAAEFGGAPLHVLQLTEHMKKHRHTVGLVAAPEPRLMQEAKSLGVQIFPNPHFVSPIRPYEDIKALRPVFNAIKAFQPDLVHAHSTKAGFAARLACAILRKPVIFTAHGWAFTEGRSLWSRRLLALAEWLAAKVTIKIICVSEHDQKLALKFKVARPEQLIVIHNGLNPQPFLYAEGTNIRRQMGLEKIPALIFVGRLAPPKDLLTLLKAFQNIPSGKLIIVGDGPLRREVERFIHNNGLADRVILTGERQDIPNLLSASDIFVLPSRWEGLPYSIIEAMLAGLPVVATHVGGVPELVEDSVTGFLIPPDDPKALSESILKLLNNPDLCRWMGQAGREKALREFTLDRMLAETQRVYEAALKSSL